MKNRKILYSIFFVMLAAFLSGCETNMVVFEPQGPVAQSILELINFSLVLMLLVVVVVFSLFGYVIWKYREKESNKDYEPEYEKGSHKLEIIWTAIPLVIVLALAVATTITTFKLEKVPEGYEDQEPLIIHVTSADWKWIFSYPEQGIETVNYMNIPEDRAVQLKMTSAGTMQSFWVPALLGQKYTMANMETKLFMVADRPGSYRGMNTNFNGQGYAHMEFEVLAQTAEDFEEWVQDVKDTAPVLTEVEYEKLLLPSVVGRMTFNETHLAWIDHAEHDAKKYINPELYRVHGVIGNIPDYSDSAEGHETDHGEHGASEEEAKHSDHDTEDTKSEHSSSVNEGNHNDHESMETNSEGGDEHGSH
ncbi:cytochrome aa3 quinol oxidase subunit II [Bacillus sp. HMF5848]|uniref:cytochrome aa3 quinol oxidase subunit II n=1 Tax=Bacillus sp. HMF5848 TaxID=2495421 RepID=UPI000F7A741F|nr:cytochrome aa3 quinol oxidase subunit II [Bacillus sp. HMF5848]RSK26667.1 cytochrome aa3 quinol oxidase subunit II [Bacillus sp. HMF5848]